MITFLDNKSVLKSRFFLLKSVMDKKDEKKKARRIVQYQNYLIDNYILNDEWIDDDELEDNLTALNTPMVQNDYKSNYNLSNQELASIFILLYPSKQEMIQKTVNEQKDIIKNNLDYAKEVKNTHDINKREYEKAKQYYPSQETRAILIEKAVEQGLNPDLLTHGLSYRNLEIAAENLARESKMKGEFDRVIAENKALEEQGADPLYVEKKWVWSRLDNTRHSNMDDETVPIDEPFIVLNEITGEEDEMMFPHDPSGSPGNVINCGCDCEYIISRQEFERDILHDFPNNLTNVGVSLI